MKKGKKFFFGMAALLLGASLFFIGCDGGDAGAKGDAGSRGVATLPGGATAALLDAYFKNTDTVFMIAAPAAETFTVPAGKTLAAAGTVPFSSAAVVINAYYGTLDLTDGAITGTAAVFTVKDAAKIAGKVPANSIPPLVAASAITADEIGGPVVLENLSLGGSGADAGDFAGFAESTHKVYVAGTLGINAAPAIDTGSAKLEVPGETTASGTGSGNGVAFGAAGGTLALPVSAAPAKITVGASDITVTSATTTSLVAGASSTGASTKLILPATTVTFTATVGGGNAGYPSTGGNPATAALSSETGLTFATLTVDGATALAKGNLTVNGTASFGSTFANTLVSVVTFNGTTATTITGMLTTNGALTIAGTGAVTLTAAPTLTNGLTVTNSGGVTLNNTLTLDASQSIAVTGSGKLIAAGKTSPDGTVIFTKATLTSAAGGKIGIAAGGAGSAPFSVTAAKIVLAPGGSFEITGDGKVTLDAAAEFSGACK